MQLNCFGTNQKHCGHQAQSDWPLFGGNFILNLDNTVNRWAKAPNERYGDFWFCLCCIVHCFVFQSQTVYGGVQGLSGQNIQAEEASCEIQY